MRKSGSLIFLCCCLITLFGFTGCVQPAPKPVQPPPPAPASFATTIIVPAKAGVSIGGVTASPFTSAVGNNMPSDLLRDINERVAARIQTERWTASGGLKVNLTGQVIHIGGAPCCPEIVVRVELTDTTSGQTLVLANVAGQAPARAELNAAAEQIAPGVMQLFETFRTAP
ncbi:MAG: hypothetical protein KKB20_17290 [Proteobacteria bacterium]|nr:hypothetical protein [Pseudomonadota bacterium]